MSILNDFKQNGFLGEEIKVFIKDNTEYYKKHFLCCEELNRYSYTVIDNVNILTSNTHGTVIMSLFIKILNAFQGAVILSKYGLDVEAQTVARPALESLFIIAAIINKEEFYDEFINTADKEREKILSRIKKYPDIFSDYQDIPELKDLEALNRKNKEIKTSRKSDIATYAKMDVQYITAYNFFSSAIHPNPGNLRSRYWVDDGKQVKELRYAPYTKDINYTLRVLCAILIEALACLDDYFSLDLRDELERQAGQCIEVFKEQ